MSGIFKNNKLEFFEKRRWRDSIFRHSPPGVTPLFVERYRGTRTANNSDSHDFWEITAVNDGSVTMIADREIEMTKGEIAIIPPQLVHREYAPREVDTFWLGFRAVITGIPGEKLTVVKSEAVINEINRLWLFSIRNSHSMASGTELDGMMLVILGRLYRELKTSRKNSDSNIRDAMQHLNENFHKDISIAELAEKYGCSEGYFFRQFKRIASDTPLNYLTAVRMKKATFYLHNSDLKINLIAAMCGFKDPYYFSRAFKNIMGMSPQKYRQTRPPK